ncbi:unnamed protein product [Adineta steineri]|uniref:Uncharacterized protein n=1 Tax=Adineta steineri TaxID=433720 RepID=A0A818UX33_9BILA|nr:unnamed protein product [Adineta steineri]
MSLGTKSKLINDINVDHFGCSNDRLGSTGITTCIGFIVTFNNGEDVFIEHKSNILFPKVVTLENMRICFKNIAKYIYDVLPTSTITVVLILGGMNDSTRFEQLHNAINGVLKNNVDNDGETESSHYRQLSNNIICNNVCFNQLQHAKDLEELAVQLVLI